MPNAIETHRPNPSGTSKKSPAEETIDLFSYPAAYDLGRLVADHIENPGARGRKPYDSVAMFLVCCVARIAGSNAAALSLLDNHDLWQTLTELFNARSGGRLLAAAPPNRDRLQYFRNRITNDAGLQSALQHRFQLVSVAQARRHGNLLSDVVPDWAQPRQQHIIYGDGTVLAPFTDVTLITHPGTGEIIALNSRAKSPTTARVPSTFSRTDEDGKTARGVNFVAMHTWTDAGRVVLGTATALRAEQWAAIALAESITKIAGDGVHSLVYDRAVTGWVVDYLMATLRIQTIGKAVGRGSDTAFTEKITDTALAGTVSRLAAEYDAEATPQIARMLRHDVLANIYYSGRPQPVGTCLYKSDSGRFDIVRSRYRFLPTATHQVDGQPCHHDLVLDDGALFTVTTDELDGHLVKQDHLPCASSHPVQRPDGRWGTRNTFTVPCPQGGDFTYVRIWEPDGTRYTVDSTEASRSPRDRIGCELRPLARQDGDRFGAVAWRRNDAESFNQWVQSRMPHHGRAASETLAAQELDFLTAAVVNNALTWARRH